ncbi:sensor histidine kinase [Streptomyces aureoverticillatus]|uniref:sensor histidine kinase n=1 Tax=Streptomyces aureoverticillatus TaxID=66871 RepID=UPI004047D77F
MAEGWWGRRGTDWSVRFVRAPRGSAGAPPRFVGARRGSAQASAGSVQASAGSVQAPHGSAEAPPASAPASADSPRTPPNSPRTPPSSARARARPLQATAAALRRRLAGRPADVLLAAAFTVIAVLLRLDQPWPDGVGPSAVAVGLLVGACVPLVWRRTCPGLALGATAACYLVGDLLDPAGDNAQSVFLACYSVARHTPAPRSLLAPVVLTAALLAPELADGRLNVYSSADTAVPLGPADYLVAAGLAAAAWLLGWSRRRLHEDAARLRDLAERLRAEQRVSARRAVTAERARIARDLHDLVAHHVSAIALQARAVTVVLPDDTHAAGQGVAAISEAADTALDEMRGLVQLLADLPPESGAGSSGGTAPLPQPSLRHLEQLTGESGAAGCPVALTVTGPVTELPPAVQVSAYRVVQEALSNVRKHAGAVPVRVELACRNGRLTVTVENAAPAPDRRPMPGSGLGLVGMRERAALFGGTLLAEPVADGGWRVVATFPPQHSGAYALEDGR